MANILFMGFEVFVNSFWNHANIWDVTPFSAFVAPSTSVPRTGGSSYALINQNTESMGTKSLGANYSHLFTGIGWMLRVAALPATPTNLDFVFYDGTTAQVGWTVSSLGEIIVYRGATTAATELGRTATGVIVAGGAAGTGADYKMIEMEVVFHASAGSVVIRVANTVVLTLTGQNTAPSGNAHANRFRLTVRTSASEPRLDDFYINDDTGSAPENTFFGEAFVVERVIPNGNGNSSQWVGSDGNSTDNYLLVDDTGNSDTDYIRSGTLNELDLHTLSDLSNATGTIIGTNHYMVARKDDVATRTIASTIRTNSTNYTGSNKTMTGTYATFVENRLVNPDTSLRFTISEINALEAGPKVTT